MIDQARIKEFQDNPVPHAIELASSIIDTIGVNRGLSDTRFLGILDAYALLQVLVEKERWKIKIPDIQPEAIKNNLQTILPPITALLEDLKRMNQTNSYASAKQGYSLALGIGPYYELTEGDLEKIQSLINKLRQAINSSSILQEDHKRRLLARLEKLQAELHKRMSDYDRAYGILMDGVVLFQQFGKAAEPITELIREVGNLFWQSHARAAQLPGDTPLPLPSPDVNDKK